MRRQSILWIITVVAVSFLTTCEKENEACPDESTFCILINNQDFDATGPVINEFLKTLQKDDDQALGKLKNWLDCKNCVKSAEILCNSCIETLPPQSEILVQFNSNGQVVEKTMDILMSEPLKFSGYH